MAVKTITIDMEAYEALARQKRPGASFSDVIKEHFRTGSTGRDVLEAVRRSPVSEEALGAAESQVRDRRRHRARSARW